MRRNRRRALVPSLDRLPSRIAPTVYPPASGFYPDFDNFGGSDSWEASGMEAISETTCVDSVIELMD